MSEPIDYYFWQVDAVKLKEENAKLRAALNEIYIALEDPEDSYPRNAFAIASKALAACGVQHTHNTREKP